MFNFGFDKRILYVIIAILAVTTLIEYATTEGALLSLLLGVPGVLIAITFHEFAHAFAADKLGDDTPRMQGRLSLNPLDHLDPVGCFLLLFAGFGWGKPVQVNPRNYNRTMSMEKADALVSIAGPVMNLMLAIVFSIIYCALYKFANAQFFVTKAGQIIMALISSTIFINIGLAIFNLLPLPPLDGSKVIRPLLPFNAKQWFQNNENIFYMIFIVLWITGLAGTIISPIINLVGSGILNFSLKIFGL